MYVVLCVLCVHCMYMYIFCCTFIVHVGVYMLHVCVCVWQFSVFFPNIYSGSERENVSLSVENTATN